MRESQERRRSALETPVCRDIAKDAEVKDFFLVVKKGIYSSKNNTRYASVSLKDKTGAIEAQDLGQG